MRWLLGIVLVLALAWGGYWFAGARAIERAAEDFFAAQGGRAARESLSVQGFPNRFDLTVTKPAFADPVVGWRWTAPFAQVFAMTWKPWHLIAVLPDSQEIDLGAQRIGITSEDLRGSLVLHPGTDLALDRLVVEGSALRAVSDLGWQIGAAKITFASAEDASRRNTHRIGLRAEGLDLGAAVAGALPDLGGVIGLIHLDAHLLLTGPIDRHLKVVELAGVEVNDLSLTWGPLQISASGSVARASEGFAEGVIDLEIQQWRQIPSVLSALRLVEPGVAQTYGKALELLAAEGADPEVLKVPLKFKAGRMSLGALPIGRAPRLN
jgi:hypothetical protein